MREGDLTDRADLAPLARIPHLYALGPLSGLHGELTIFDSKPYVARVGTEKTQPQIGHADIPRTPFLVWARVDRWREISWGGPPVPDLSALETRLEAAAKRAGIDRSRPFVFRIVGTARKGEYHVLDRKGNVPHSHAEHAKIQVRYPLANAQVELLGFWSDRHYGVWTHHGENVHIHLRTRDGKGSGHLDKIDLVRGAQLFVPY